MTPDMRVLQGVLGIVTYLRQPNIDNALANKIILDTVNEVGPMQTIVGLTNFIRILMILREQEVGVPADVTLSKIAMTLAQLDDEKEEE